MKIHVKAWFLIVCLVGSSMSLFAQTGKPELIITNIQLRIKNSYSRDRLGSSHSSLPIATVTVKNIGQMDFAEGLYLAYTNDEEDMRRGHYSHSTPINPRRQVIKPGDSLTVEFRISSQSNNKKFWFILSRHGGRKGVVPAIEIENIKISTYECEFPNYHKAEVWMTQ